MALSLGCPARRIRSLPELIETLDQVLPALAARNEPLLLDVRVAPDTNSRGRPS
jgi:benzoylformate decarboxylase